MKADSTTLAGILSPAQRFVIPMFQRDYSWTLKEWENLWDDIIELSGSNRNSRNHFMGTLVFVSEPILPNKLLTFQVIDGQQRLVTLSIILCALRDVALGLDFQALADELTDSYLVHQYKKEDEHYRVYPRWRDRDQYISAVECKSVAGETIRKSLEFFMQRIELMPNNKSEEGLRSFFNMLCNRLEFVQINLGQDENPFQIFRSLNSTGMELAESDLIRNFMFMQLSEKNQTEFDKSYWQPLERHFESKESKQKGQLDGKAFSVFLRNFLMHRGHYVGVNNTFEEFEAYCKGKTDAIEIVRELDENVSLYDVIRGLKPHPSGETKIDDALKQLRGLESSTTFPLVLNLLERVKLGTLPVYDAVHSIKLISGFILRRYICAMSSRTYGTWFVQACGHMKASPLEDLRTYLQNKGYPDDSTFQEALLVFNLYKGNYASTILKALEMSLPHKEGANLAAANVEHIMPQKLTSDWILVAGPQDGPVHQRWLHTLGNLTITGYNGELANKSFIAKRKIYSESHFELTKNIAKMNTPIWGEKQIESRGKALAERAKNIWIGPFA